MTLKDILGWVIGIAVIFGGGWAIYQWHQSQSIASFSERMSMSGKISNLADLVAFVRDAPTMQCHESESGFDASQSVAFYHASGRTRFIFQYIQTGKTMNEIIDDSGFYVWWSDDTTITHVSPGQYDDSSFSATIENADAESAVASIFSHNDCTTWTPNSAAFTLPGLLVKEYVSRS